MTPEGLGLFRVVEIPSESSHQWLVISLIVVPELEILLVGSNFLPGQSGDLPLLQQFRDISIGCLPAQNVLERRLLVHEDLQVVCDDMTGFT